MCGPALDTVTEKEPNMNSWQRRIIQAMMVLSAGILPAATIDCDLEDGELELDIDGGHDYHDDYYGGEFFYYEEDPWYYWW